MTVGEREAAITGIGRSAIGRRLQRDPLDLTIDACLAAIADAGLAREEIDGLAVYPGSAVAAPPGYSGAGAAEVQDALRLQLAWCGSGIEAPGALGPLMNACLAVAAGVATHVLCFTTLWEGTAHAQRRRPDGAPPPRASGELAWTLPFGACSAIHWLALVAQRHFHEHGTTREQLAQIALTARRHASLAAPDAAVYRDPLALDDYLAARWVSTPLCLYDCDVPSDGSVAVVVSRADAPAPRPGRPPLRVHAIGCARRGRPSWDQAGDLTAMAMHDAAAMMWRRSDLRPADVDVAQIYDGVSFLTLAWLEALGFCGRGEAGAFVGGGDRIALGGELPLNTGGGQLSGGRLSGHGLLHEACAQLWGEAGARQVPDARVALVAVGGGPFGGCLLLARG